MTHITILGQSQGDESRKKIEFVKYLNVDGADGPCVMQPHEYENVVLIASNYQESEFDLIFAFDLLPDEGQLFLGKWNDGIV